jgi:hypothetical protein
MLSVFSLLLHEIATLVGSPVGCAYFSELEKSSVIRPSGSATRKGTARSAEHVMVSEVFSGASARVSASSEAEIDRAFVGIQEQRPSGLVVDADAFLLSRQDQILK